MAGIATLVLLLGLGGAIFGISAAGRPTGDGSDPTTLPQSVGSPTVTPTVTPTVGPGLTASPTGPTASGGVPFPLPDLAGGDFKAARATVRDLGLGWRLEFAPTGSDLTVRETDPAAGAQVRRGTTVKIYVRGAAPLAVIPDVLGKPCAEAAELIVEAGLYPTYPTGRTGVVLEHSATTAALHWNDAMEISCGTAP